MRVFVGAALLALVVVSPALARSGGGSGGYHFVSGYTTSRGTYVAPHAQTDANGTKLDNWSTKGNVNPITGSAGTKNPD